MGNHRSEAEDYTEISVRQSEDEREQRHGQGEAHGQVGHQQSFLLNSLNVMENFYRIMTNIMDSSSLPLIPVLDIKLSLFTFSHVS